MKKDLMPLYRLLLGRFGPQKWWPADSDFEVIVGAVLTQNTSWLNVEKAIGNIKKAKLLKLELLTALPEKKLSLLIKPSGYFRLKAKRLRAVMNFLAETDNGDWIKFLTKSPMEIARKTLLSVYGIGPETADSILLYAAKRPTFVIDKYTLRFGTRFGLFGEDTGYDKARTYFMDRLPGRAKLYNEYHALLVAVGKYYCKTKPVCEGCPVEGVCKKLLV